MLTIYTHTNNPLKKEFWKYIVKKTLGKYSGPDAVLDSLKRGLMELNIPFEVNPIKSKYKTVHVLSGIEILKEIVKKKSAGKIKTLIVGPSTVQTPYDYNNLIQDRNIDILLFPSKWPKDWFINLESNLNDKIKIWPAGVKIPEKSSNHEKVLVFRKNVSEDIYKMVINTLDHKKIEYDIIAYGTYTRKDYIQKLLSTSILIYLQKSESQGLALQEAWAHNVPTLVWQNKDWEYGKYKWSDEKVAAPYLTDECGKFFTVETFSTELDLVLNNINIFNPRKYCIENLSDEVSAQKYLEIIKIQQ